MLKKILLVLVVLSFVCIPAMARDQNKTEGSSGDTYQFKAYDWPIEFKAVPIGFKIDVKMDVGLYFEITNRKELQEKGIKLVQRELNVYTGCSEIIKIQTNFDMVLGATVAFVGVGADLGPDKTIKAWIVCDTYNCTLTADIATADNCGFVAKNLSGDAQKRKVFVKLTKVKVYELDFGKNIKIAEVTLTVKPGFEAWWEDP
jgi:hypothetical protein